MLAGTSALLLFKILSAATEGEVKHDGEISRQPRRDRMIRERVHDPYKTRLKLLEEAASGSCAAASSRCHVPEPAEVILAAYHHAAEGRRIGSCMPGPNRALPTLLAARAWIIDQDTYMASSPALFDPTRRISDGGIL